MKFTEDASGLVFQAGLKYCGCWSASASSDTHGRKYAAGISGDGRDGSRKSSASLSRGEQGEWIRTKVGWLGSGDGNDTSRKYSGPSSARVLGDDAGAKSGGEDDMLVEKL